MKIIDFILFIVIALFSVSCDRAEVPDPEGPDTPDDVALVFNVDIFPISRAEVDNSFNTVWAAGDAIGVFATPFGEELTSENCLISNAKLVYDGSTWTLDGDSESVWPGQDALDFYAYYPYDESYTDPLNLKFNVNSDQSEESAYSSGNLMLAKVSGVARGAVVSLMFRHTMCLVNVSFPALESGNDNIEVFLHDVSTEASFDIVSGEVSLLDNNKSDVKLFLYSKTSDMYVYRAWLPAQQMLNGQPAFMFLYFDYFKRFSSNLSSDLILSSGHVASVESFMPCYVPMVKIEAGTFVMGTPVAEEGHSDREMQHEVTLTKDFYMTSCEITNSQYAEFLNDMKIKNVAGNISEISGNVDGYGDCVLFQKDPNWNLTYDDATKKWIPVQGKEDYPVSFVSWYGAKAYADWIGGTLPTEAQWEYACRAGSTTPWSFGEDNSIIGDYAWCDINSPDNGPSKVGTKLPNAWGLYDMHGNLYEWCLDWYDDSYGLDNIDQGTTVTDPTGPDSGMYKVIRGGSWLNYWYYLRSGYRNIYFPNYLSDLAGFRVVFIVD